MADYPTNILGAVGADGAFQIDDGGGSYNYGQDYNEQVVRALFTPTVPNPVNALGLLAQELSKLPLEALQFFKDLIPDWIEGAFDTVSGAVNAIINAMQDTVTFLTSTEFLRWLTQDLPEMILGPIRGLVTALVEFLEPIPLVGGAVHQLATLLGLMNTKTQEAKASADNANVGVARLEGQVQSGNVTGGILVDDTFGRTGSLSPEYTVTMNGLGSVSLDGNNVHWSTNGSDPASADILRNTSLHTPYQGIQLVHTQAFDNISVPPWIEVYGRSNASKTHRVRGIIHRDYAEIGIHVGGVYTRLGSTVGVSVSPGDKWKLRLGTENNVREFVLYQNANEVMRRTDTGGTSLYGPGYDQPGFLMGAGQHFAFFFFQVAAPDIQSFTAYDRLPEAA